MLTTRLLTLKIGIFINYINEVVVFPLIYAAFDPHTTPTYMVICRCSYTKAPKNGKI